jgi:ribonuclease HI
LSPPAGRREASAWIDGAARGNPGEAGFGVVFEEDGDREEILGFLGRTTNNVAEYAALVAALTWAAERRIEKLRLHSDSQLVVRQLTGVYRVKAPHLVPIFLKVIALRRRVPAVELRHVPREQNREADRLANRAIDEHVPIPAWLEIELPGAP